MAITELALLHLKGTSSSSLSDGNHASLRASLLTAKKAMEQFTGHPFHFYAQIEDPSYIYIFGAWDSVEQHRQEWLPSAANLALLDVLKDAVNVDWMVHVEIDPLVHGEGPGGAREQQTVASREDGFLGGQERVPFSAPVMAIARYTVSAANKAHFADTFNENKHHLGAFLAPRCFRGGWQVNEDGQDEQGDGQGQGVFVLFGGFETVEQHLAFAQTDGFNEYGKIREWVAAFDVKHAKRLDFD